jgi:hypothetical protein
MNFPSTIVLSINVHGGFDSIVDGITGEKKLPIIKIPDELDTFIKIDSVPIGYENYVNEKEIENYINIIKYQLKSNYYIEKCCNKRIILEQITTNIINKYKKTFKVYTKKYPDDEFYKHIYFNKMYQIKKFNRMDKIINKSFCYSKDEKNKLIKNISILNKGYEYDDLFEILNKNCLCNRYEGGLEISLYGILNFLVQQGVKKVIMFDFTCFNVLPEKEFTPRHLRKIRREELKMNKKRSFEEI